MVESRAAKPKPGVDTPLEAAGNAGLHAVPRFARDDTREGEERALGAQIALDNGQLT